MKLIYSAAIRLTSIALLIAIVLAGCATTYKSEEQEGGITGTGNDINCEEERNKKRKECIGEI